MEANTSGPSITGWMSKKGGGSGAGFKRRFFKLINKELLYYKKDDPKTAALGWIDLSKALCTYTRALVPESGGTGKLVANKYKNEFSILCIDRNWIFRADSPGSKDTWLKKIQEAIESIDKDEKGATPKIPAHKKLFEFSKVGCLVKRGNHIKTWKPRHFGLSARTKTLYYFKNELDLDFFRRIAPHSFEASLDHVQGTIPLGTCSVRDNDPKSPDYEKKDNVFWIDTPQRNFPLQASSAQEMKVSVRERNERGGRRGRGGERGRGEKEER